MDSHSYQDSIRLCLVEIQLNDIVTRHYLVFSVFLQDENTPLIEAAKEGHIDTVKELLSSGATVDLADHVIHGSVCHSVLLLIVL